MRRTPPNTSRPAATSKNGKPTNGNGKPGKRSAASTSDFDESSSGHGDDDDVHSSDTVDSTDADDASHDDEADVEIDFDSVGGSSESHIDDPIRMYLMQMGEIPMLNREREISSAKAIEATRTHFRRTLLANDFVLQGAVDLLEKVQNGELRLDRTIEISVTNTAEKKRTLKRIVPNLVTIKHLLRLNQIDYRAASEPSPRPGREEQGLASTRLASEQDRPAGRRVESPHRPVDADHGPAA